MSLYLLLLFLLLLLLLYYCYYFTCSGLQLGISAEIECRQLHCTLRDLTTMERALGRLSEHFIGEVNFANRFSDGEAIVDRLGQISLFGTQSQLYEVETALPSVLLPDLIEV